MDNARPLIWCSVNQFFSHGELLKIHIQYVGNSLKENGYF
ncbi:hypothetical protein YpAngola_B0087 (plasmid) [Yersinia pestis Angola]|nr:hypothetical protein YpAngola_B0087 [Yersinia pestis Angola]